MTVQALACGQVIHRHGRAICRSTIIAPRAQGRRNILRTIVNSVGIGRTVWRGYAVSKMIRSAADRFVVDRRCNSAGLVRRPPRWFSGGWYPVAVRMRNFDRIGTQQRQLACEHAACLSIGKADGIGIDELRSGRSSVNPSRFWGRAAHISETDKQSLEVRLNVSYSGFPVAADGGLARTAAHIFNSKSA